ncbi:hypothetical protein DBR32_06485 [Taibaiella sp. KBW10]|uniref:tRNA1(Val) (adenine(37)-N6)-methyltransferase n=1 Tax=Taibaiella sp. KBW10 TaxID=2153357 RepID=UPI000F5923F0|nr:methyltransferase [Taibaiella sp. KBW10]RQO31597.1 hypothetical protein DBR32_06485 [Taibaiella sp. KBW10]
MANSYFDFKQFRIAQDHCAMKVSTDACIQGAWLAKVLQLQPPARLLDIGTGTGLLSLLLAQSLPEVHITAIEINEQASIQAADNIQQSPWANRIQVQHTSLQQFSPAEDAFEAIICNPPFFHKHLESKDEDRSAARHSPALSKAVLAEKVQEYLAPEGQFGLMYPVSEWADWLKVAAQQGLYCQRQLRVQPHQQKEANRVVGVFGKKPCSEPLTETLCIYEAGTRTYTSDFILLMKQYYIYL